MAVILVDVAIKSKMRGRYIRDNHRVLCTASATILPSRTITLELVLLSPPSVVLVLSNIVYFM